MTRVQIASDTFASYADGHLQAVSSGAWTDTDAGYNGWVQVTSHTVLATSGPVSDAYWSGAGSFTSDQYASMTINALGFGNDTLGAAARVGTGLQPTSNSGYRSYIFCNGGSGVITLTLAKVIAGTETILGTDTTQSALWTVGDTIDIECQGTSIRALRNAVPIITVTDSALSSGLPGLCAAVGASALTGTPWKAGNLTVAPPAAQHPGAHSSPSVCSNSPF